MKSDGIKSIKIIVETIDGKENEYEFQPKLPTRITQYFGSVSRSDPTLPLGPLIREHTGENTLLIISSSDRVLEEICPVIEEIITKMTQS